MYTEEVPAFSAHSLLSLELRLNYLQFENRGLFFGSSCGRGDQELTTKLQSLFMQLARNCWMVSLCSFRYCLRVVFALRSSKQPQWTQKILQTQPQGLYIESLMVEFAASPFPLSSLWFEQKKGRVRWEKRITPKLIVNGMSPVTPLEFVVFLSCLGNHEQISFPYKLPLVQIEEKFSQNKLLSAWDDILGFEYLNLISQVNMTFYWAKIFTYQR